MSYSPLRNEDSLSELFSQTNDFFIVKDNLVKYKDDPEAFTVWLNKCVKSDVRSTVIFLRDHKDIFSGRTRSIVDSFLNKFKKKDISQFI